MTLAIIKTGGKQYIVSPGQKIKIDPPASLREALLAGPPASATPKALRAGGIEGQEIIFDEVLLLEKNKKIEIGTPLARQAAAKDGEERSSSTRQAKVFGKILKQGKGKKVIIFKYKAKKRYKTKKGHRQPYIEVEIVKIES